MKELKSLKSIHRHIMRLEAAGIPKTRIAQITGLSKQQVSIVTRSELYLDELAKLQNDLNEALIEKKTQEALDDPTMSILKSATLEAATELVSIAKTGCEGRGQISAIESILDRTGYGKSERVQVDASINLPTENAAMVAAAIERAARSGRNVASEASGDSERSEEEEATGLDPHQEPLPAEGGS